MQIVVEYIQMIVEHRWMVEYMQMMAEHTYMIAEHRWTATDLYGRDSERILIIICLEAI
jgi:hypothetical protein